MQQTEMFELRIINAVMLFCLWLLTTGSLIAFCSSIMIQSLQNECLKLKLNHPRPKKWCFIHTWLEVCALTVPSRLLRAISAYAERKAVGREEEIRLNISLTHSLCIFPQVAGAVWLQLLPIGDTLEAPIKTNLTNVGRLASCQAGQQ